MGIYASYWRKGLIALVCVLTVSLEGGWFSTKNLTYQGKRDGVSLSMQELTKDQKRELFGKEFKLHLDSSKLAALQVTVENRGNESVRLTKDSLSVLALNKKDIEDAFLSTARFTRTMAVVN